MGDFSITVQNFASLPAGVALVWAAMTFLNQALPSMTTRAKVVAQMGCAALYAILATLLYSTGSVRELAQQGVVLFFSVAFAQTWGYEATMKLTGLKGDGKPLAFRAPKVAPAPVPAPAPAPTNPAVAPFADYGDQGSPNGRV